MGGLRFTISGMVGTIVILALWLAAMRIATDLVCVIAGVSTISILLASVGAACYHRGLRRAFWLGFAGFGWTFLLMTGLHNLIASTLTEGMTHQLAEMARRVFPTPPIPVEPQIPIPALPSAPTPPFAMPPMLPSSAPEAVPPAMPPQAPTVDARSPEEIAQEEQARYREESAQFEKAKALYDDVQSRQHNFLAIAWMSFSFVMATIGGLIVRFIAARAERLERAARDLIR